MFPYVLCLYYFEGRSTMTANGKSIGEVRDFEELKVQGIQNVADVFPQKLNY
ncbi:hypothetical protein [Candidatus Ornithobacterium hominis]|uniref:hypothetical protein n=1 Tax=Candidatus Ornithobacterium hominis TaxID=2497989 RepID=UPI001401D9BB|nr:hypothetical protein [Candidatus Ornithobacterium hominis]